jgi:ABC-type Fe3+-hydroxamate transport system substrate-binding protein
MRKISVLALLAVLALAAGACGERSEPTGSTVKLFPVSVSPPSGGAAITLRHAPTRVAAVGSSAIATAGALLPGAEKPQLLEEKTLDSGRLRSFHPEIVIDSAGDPSVATLRRLAKAPVYTFAASSIRENEEAIVDVGALLGDPLQARRVNADIELRRLEVQRKIETLPRASVFVDTGFYITISTDSLAGEVLSGAGGKSIAGANPGPSPVGVGLLRRKNPDFYLATSSSGVSLKDLRKNPRTRGLRAVKEGHFAVIPASYLQPGPAVGDALLAIAKLLHPNAFG